MSSCSSEKNNCESTNCVKLSSGSNEIWPFWSAIVDFIDICLDEVGKLYCVFERFCRERRNKRLRVKFRRNLCLNTLVFEYEIEQIFQLR